MIAYAVVIFVQQLIFGEMVPKFYAVDRAESVARRVARPALRELWCAPSAP